jgi:glyoxylase-like metal-dependent hydrolase (beta-lactamase superfamily II)
MRTIAPGVEEISFGYVNAFVLDGGTTLIDSGPSRSGRRLRSALETRGRSLRDILITHHHVDHVGPLSSIASDGVTVWAHAQDARVLRGKARGAPAPRNALERLAVWGLDHTIGHPRPARVDREIADGEEIPAGDGLIAVHTPGHTAGHMSFLMPSKRVLFVGDAAANYLGRLGPPVGVYNEDHDEVKRSIAKVAALDFDIACFGHGRTLKGDACAAFRRLADKVAS